MTVYKKLMEARIKLQSMQLNKSGHNKFAGYQYFELGDFLPQTQSIFAEVGLCGVISFGETIATLDIYCVDGSGVISIQSPMKEANLKGCHPIQNLGAVETYTRRYLWVTAMEIVEHDALDSTTGKDEPKQQKQAAQKTPSAEKQTISDERLESAIAKILAGEYTLEKLRNSFVLNEDQYALLIAKGIA